MYIGIFLSVVELIGDDMFAIAIGEEVYRARGDDADERGPEALEQRARGLVSRDISTFPKRSVGRIMGVVS